MRSHDKILADVAATNERLRKANTATAALQDKRRALYVEAREGDTPVPFKDIAAAAGTTEAAVMQVVKKGRAREDVT